MCQFPHLNNVYLSTSGFWMSITGTYFVFVGIQLQSRHRTRYISCSCFFCSWWNVVNILMYTCCLFCILFFFITEHLNVHCYYCFSGVPTRSCHSFHVYKYMYDVTQKCFHLIRKKERKMMMMTMIRGEEI